MKRTSTSETRVFVYGTLLSGEPNHNLLHGARLVGPARTRPRFTLHDYGPFPALASGGKHAVEGEVYEVDAPMLAELDRLESHPRFYRRTPITLDDVGRLEAYLFPKERLAAREEEFYLPLSPSSSREMWRSSPPQSPWEAKACRTSSACTGDSFSWTPEILAVEVRGTTEDLLSAYGQAAAHQLFATKTYLALPHTLSFSDKRELMARCQLHGLGLILFGPSPRDEYTALVPARRCPPAPAEAQRFSEQLRAHDEEKFRTLFG